MSSFANAASHSRLAYSALMGGLFLFSSPGLVAGAGKLGLSTAGSPASGLVGGLVFDPDGTAAPPLADGSGVSAAKPEVLTATTAANNRPETRNMSCSLSAPPVDLTTQATGWLRAELKDTGVTVTCLMPGATETEFFDRADLLDTKVGQSPRTTRRTWPRPASRQ
jgi:hypothetical protein